MRGRPVIERDERWHFNGQDDKCHVVENECM